jgi:hypothetical protein
MKSPLTKLARSALGGGDALPDTYKNFAQFIALIRCPLGHARAHLKMWNPRVFCAECGMVVDFRELLYVYQMHHTSMWLPLRWWGQPQFWESEHPHRET